jgi:lambda repressor-like predicted transcriptional regulator
MTKVERLAAKAVAVTAARDAAIVEMREKGASLRDIASEAKIPLTTISRILNRTNPTKESQ